MAVLVIAEHDKKSIKGSTFNTITAARKLNSDVHILFAGHGFDDVKSSAGKIHGVSKVLIADGAEYTHALAENMSVLIVSIAPGYSHILFPATTFGKNISPRVAALLDIQQVSDVSEIIDAKTFKHPVYGGQAIATVQTSDEKVILTVRATSFDPVKSEGGNPLVETLSGKGDSGLSSFSGMEISKSDRPELTAAKIVVSGGRGVGSSENFAIIEQLADKLGAAVGASRAAVDAGYVPNDYQVGQTGKVVAPELYVAVGISGAIQHLAGMKDSKVIVAINKDPEAPIFQVADYGLVADLFSAVPEMKDKI